MSEENMELDEVRALFSEGPLYLWVMEFGITHFAMRLAVHRGDYPRSVEILCNGCTYLCGAMQGGPYQLRLNGLEGGQLEIVGGDRELVIRCGTAKIGRRRH